MNREGGPARGPWAVTDVGPRAVTDVGCRGAWKSGSGGRRPGVVSTG